LRFLDFVDLSDKNSRAAHTARIDVHERYEPHVTLRDHEYMIGIAVSNVIEVEINS
jgi:hypothetical protein